ncbi:Dolichyl-diphosphooligosaccharide-protein glycosyltransferase 48kDa subunit [Coemansia reversa NRRL 1564]|uniref:Dolichyl-diphosphooligosaccharide--protein glycosyltransferase subunit WBP1 n=1 Tax=Coemansia reversa (strain ATCC 12441 / NRRL 1564) TaxID=763665 RepID=A0A2G5BAU0_COERN|nr:Dolichyl-diphosphooligosaccharide-protein glycosyltransferase 48kDa subunit [Coemansia reversa NRRL 1564]|eukprot:PIA16120.1 Dolichyl-diphosphooligosaccharide-protein glycosyltransferase 48kDa subunit [Coemansia reversa NRRL 1564]
MRLGALLRTWLAFSSICLPSASARSVTGDRLLVLVPAVEAAIHDYSIFLDSLKRRGFEVSIRDAANSSIVLHIDGDRLYDHVALLAPAAKRFGAALSIHDFIHFVNTGGNMIVAASAALSDFHRRLAAQFGVEFDKHGTAVIDHSHYLSSKVSSNHTIVAASRLSHIPAVLSPPLLADEHPTIYFEGIAHNYDSQIPLLAPLLTGSRSTYSGSSVAVDRPSLKSTQAQLSGRSLGLVSIFQSRSNARVVFSGSSALFSDALVGAEHSTNGLFINDISQWAFQEKSVLREVDHRHRLASAAPSSLQPDHYRVSNVINYEIDLSVYYENKWHPYIADDVQFEATMLDPYLRLTLNRTQVPKSATVATYHGDIKLPDRYGTFTFSVNYKRAGFSSINVHDTVAIWPLRHDEYPRFLSAAYPYYAGSFVMVAGFLALCAAWLWNTGPTSKSSKPKSS